MTKDNTPEDPQMPEQDLTQEIRSAEAMSQQDHPVQQDRPVGEDTSVIPTDDTAHFETASGSGQDLVSDSALADAAHGDEPAVTAAARADESQDPFWQAGAAARTNPADPADPAIPAVPVAAAAASASVAGATAYGDGPTGPKGPGFWKRTGATWRRVWASTIGKVLVIGAAALAVLAIVAAIGMAAFWGGRGHGGSERSAWAACAEQDPPGQTQQGQGNQGQGKRGQGRSGKSGKSRNGGQGDCQNGENGENGQNGEDGMGQQGQGRQGQQGQQWGENEGPNAGQGNGQNSAPTVPGLGNGRGQGGLQLGAVLHGEVVVGGATPKSVLYQTGAVTEVTAGTSLSVKSTDGFTATYALTPTSTVPTTGLAQGQTVRVIADKEGAKVTLVAILKSATATN